MNSADGKRPTLFDTSLAALAVLDAELNVQAANATLGELIGYEQDELPGRNWAAIGNRQDELQTLLSSQLSSGKWGAALRHRNGQSLSVNLAAERRTDDGQTCLLVLLQPAAQWLEQTQESLRLHRQNDDLYRTLIQTTPDGFWIVDGRTGRFLEVNGAFSKLLGYPQEAFYEMTWQDIEAGETAGASLSDLARQRHGHIELDLRRADGTTFLADISLTVMPGESPSIVGFCYDASPERLAARQLKENERRFRAIFEQPAIGIAIVKPNGRTVRANDRLCQVAGCRSVDLIDRSLLLFAHPEDAGQMDISLTKLANGEEKHIALEARLIHQDGHVVWVNLVGGLVTDDDGVPTYLVLLVEDISERQEARHELVHLNDELRQKNRELEQVVYVASHDLRSPLVNVQGFSRELEASLKDLNKRLVANDVPATLREEIQLILEEEIPESLDFILTSIEKMDKLLTGLLSLSRIGRAPLQLDTLEMNELIDTVIKSNEYQIQERGISVTVGDLPPCRGDATQIQQVMSNLVDNALKYLRPDCPGEIQIQGERQAERVVYSVADNGIGIAPEHQEKVFDLYHRLQPGETTGEGLGLTIIRTIVDRHHGRIWLESAPGIGTCFHVALPTP